MAEPLRPPGEALGGTIPPTLPVVLIWPMLSTSRCKYQLRVQVELSSDMDLIASRYQMAVAETTLLDV